LKERVNNQIQRNIDLMMINIGHYWRSSLRAWALVFSFALMIGSAYAVLLTFPEDARPSLRLLIDQPAEWFIWGTIAIVGAYLAPLFHDILMRLSGR